MKYRYVVFIIINSQIQKLMRFTFFTAVVAACNLITYSQASSLIQNETQLFEEPATIFSQVDAQPMMPKKGGPKEGPKRMKPDQIDEGTAGKAAKKEETEAPKKSGPAAKPTQVDKGSAKPKKTDPAAATPGKEPVKK